MIKTIRKRDKKISIGKLEQGTDEDGFPTKEEFKVIPGGKNIWAYYRHVSGKEFFEAMAINQKVEVIFEIAWRNDLKTDMQIRYKNEDYNITQIDDFEGYKRTLKISAYKVN